MPRNIDAQLAASLSNGLVSPAVLVEITFKSRISYAWTGTGNLAWSGNLYIGQGSLGQIGAIKEGVQVKADGTTITLSGIDPILMSECLEDIGIGLPAKIWYAHLIPGTLTLIGQPYQLFGGTVDKPSFNISGQSLSITLALESKLVNHSRATVRRYTTADQHLAYPDDTAFKQVEVLNDLALYWG